MKRSKATAINKDKIICFALFGVVIALFALYTYFVSATVAHVVIRKEVSQDLVALHTDISQLETEYIDAQHRVSEEIASLEGYQPVSHKVFIDRTPDSLVLSNTMP